MNKSQLRQKHKEIIQELEEPELMAYLDNISRNKIDNLSFFTDSDKASNGNIKEYLKYADIEEETTDILAEKEEHKYIRDLKKGLGYGITATLDYNNLIKKYVEQVEEAKLIYFNKLLYQIVLLHEDIKKDFNYLDNTLNLFFIVWIGTPETASEELSTLEEAFNIMIEDIYSNLKKSFNQVDLYSAPIKKLEETVAKDTDNIIISSELAEVLSDLFEWLNYCLAYKDMLAELEEEPFKKGAVNRIEAFLTVIYGVEDIRLDSFKETLTEEKDIELVNKLTESVEVEVPSYDFKNFQLIEPEGVVESGS